MATEIIEKELHAITLDRQEAANLIGLLAAQLAGTTLQGNMSGACPEVRIVDRGVVKHRICFVVNK